MNQKLSFWIIQNSELLSAVSEEISAETTLFQRWFLALKLSVFSAVQSWISAVQRFSGNEQRWNRPESILNQSWSALNVSETSTRVRKLTWGLKSSHGYHFVHLVIAKPKCYLDLDISLFHTFESPGPITSNWSPSNPFSVENNLKVQTFSSFFQASSILDFSGIGFCQFWVVLLNFLCSVGLLRLISDMKLPWGLSNI